MLYQIAHAVLLAALVAVAAGHVWLALTRSDQ
jgi:hypothetical protein